MVQALPISTVMHKQGQFLNFITKMLKKDEVTVLEATLMVKDSILENVEAYQDYLHSGK